MTAAASDTFDPEAVAARVADRQQVRNVPTGPPSRLARNEGYTVGGTGEAHGLPVPVEPVHLLDEDPIERMERLRAEKQVRSPFGLPGETRDVRGTPPPTVTPVDEDYADREFVTPGIDDEEPDEEPSTGPAPRQVPAPQPPRHLPDLEPPAPRPSTVAPPAPSHARDEPTDPEPAGEQAPSTATPELPVDVAAWALLLVDTDEHPDARVRAARTAVLACIDVLAMFYADAARPAPAPHRAALPGPGPARRNPGAATRDRMARLAAAGATSHDVRAWARQHGVPCGDRGVPTKRAVDAFLAAREVSA